MKSRTILQTALMLTVAGTIVARSPPTTLPKLTKTTADSRRDNSRKAALEKRIRSRQEAKRLDRLHRETGISSNKVEVSTVWAGAVIKTLPPDETWKTVTGTVTLPDLVSPSQPYGELGEYFAYVWVGLDGVDAKNDNLFQTGFSGEIINGEPDWWGWVCWYQGNDTQFDMYILNATSGDNINMTVQAASHTEGTFWLDNLSTGESISYSLSNRALNLQAAEWIVEDPVDLDSDGKRQYVVWPDFGTVVFENAVATTNTGTSVGPADANYVVIQSYYGNITQNSVSTTDTTVSVTWLNSAPCCQD